MDQHVPPKLSVELHYTPELAAELNRERNALELAQAYVITGAPEEKAYLAQQCNTLLQTVKSTIKRFKEKKAGFVAPAKQIIANAESLFDPTIDSLTQAEKYLKDQLTAYNIECERLADEARRRREEEERAARQKAEAAAAAERAKAEQQAAAARRAAQEAEERRQAAEREGNVRAAAAAAAAKAKAEEQARAVVENAESKATETILAASAKPSTVPVIPEAPKLDGFSTRDNWVAELAPGCDEAKALRFVVAAIAGVDPESLKRPDLLVGVKLDMPAWNRLAKALKAGMSVPGIVAKNRPVAASRAA